MKKEVDKHFHFGQRKVRLLDSWFPVSITPTLMAFHILEHENYFITEPSRLYTREPDVRTVIKGNIVLKMEFKAEKKVKTFCKKFNYSVVTQ